MPTMGALRLCGWPEPARAEARTGDGAVEPGVAEGEDAAVGSHEPIAASVRRRGDAHDRALQVQRTGRAVEPGVAEGEDAAVGTDQPVPVRAAAAAAAEAEAGAAVQRARSSVNMKVWVAGDPTPLVALRQIVYVPPSPGWGVPSKVAVVPPV